MRRIQKIIRYLYWLIVPTLVLTVGLAIYFLPEPYKFFQDYLSELGAQISIKEEINNQISSIIMSVGFGFCAFISIVISILYFANDFQYKYLKGSLGLVLAFGSSLTAIPQDKGNLIILHTIGAALFILGFGILNFTLQLLRFVKKHQEIPEVRRFDYYLDASIVVLVFAVIVLVVAFFIPSEITKNPILILLAIIFQKIVLIVDCLALLVLDLDDM